MTTGQPFKILLSYHYFRTNNLDADVAKYFPQPPHIFGDSGAYSAMTQGAPIDLGEYADWCHRWKHLFDVYVNLDVIGASVESANKTWKNQVALEKRGLAPLPVFHAGEPWSALDRLLDHGYTYIGLGGLVARRMQQIMPWLISCFRRAEGRAVFHGFGLTTWSVVRLLPFYSIDSSSWGSGFRYGSLNLFDPDKGKFTNMQLRDKVAIYEKQHAKLIRGYGFDPAVFANDNLCTREDLCQIAARSCIRSEQWLQQHHGPVVIPGTELSGPLRYNADGSLQNLSDAIHGLRWYNAIIGMQQFESMIK